MDAARWRRHSSPVDRGHDCSQDHERSCSRRPTAGGMYGCCAQYWRLEPQEEIEKVTNWRGECETSQDYTISSSGFRSMQFSCVSGPLPDVPKAVPFQLNQSTRPSINADRESLVPPGSVLESRALSSYPDGEAKLLVHRSSMVANLSIKYEKTSRYMTPH